MTTQRYDARTPDGRTRRVSIPDDPTPEEALYDALRDTLSPQAVAAIAAYLQPANVRNADVQRQVDGFREMLIEMLGEGQYEHLVDEAGL